MRSFKFEYITDRARLYGIADLVRRARTIGLDLETTGFDPLLGRPRLLSLNIDGALFVIDLFRTEGLTERLRDALDNPNADWGRALYILHNAKFDQKWMLYHFNIILYPLFDTYRASKLIYNGSEEDDLGHKLTTVYVRELKKTEWVAQMGDSNWGSPQLSEDQLQYAAEDIFYLPMLYPLLREKLQQLGLLRVAKLEMEAVLPEAAIELRGLRLDSALWLAAAREHEDLAHKLRMELLKKLPNPNGQKSLFSDEGAFFNVDSGQQLLASLARMGIKLEDSDKKTLAMSAGQYPILREILNYRKFATRVSSFGGDYLKNLHPITHRIHSGYYPFTGAGRYSNSKPNLQQIPNAPIFRRCFRAPDGRVIVAADYSQIEVRLVGELAQDPTLIRVYNEGLDVHQFTASQLVKKAMDQITKEERKSAKPAVFGLIYGMKPEKLVIYATANYGVPMTLEQAEAFYDRFFETYAGVRSLHQRILRIDRKRGFSRTILGRIRYLDKEREYNAFFNSPIQGSGADGLKRALWNVYWRLRRFGDRAFMVHMVHDEIIVECDDDPHLIEEVKAELVQGMVDAMEGILVRIPCVAEAAHGPSWAEAH